MFLLIFTNACMLEDPIAELQKRHAQYLSLPYAGNSDRSTSVSRAQTPILQQLYLNSMTQWDRLASTDFQKFKSLRKLRRGSKTMTDCMGSAAELSDDHYSDSRFSSISATASPIMKSRLLTAHHSVPSKRRHSTQFSRSNSMGSIARQSFSSDDDDDDVEELVSRTIRKPQPENSKQVFKMNVQGLKIFVFTLSSSKTCIL